MCSTCVAGLFRAKGSKKNGARFDEAEVFPLMGQQKSLRPVGKLGQGSEKRLSVANMEKHLSEHPDSSNKTRPMSSSMSQSSTRSNDVNRRSSQNAFADKNQTIIILDWDDTLFPSTYIRSDLNFSLRRSLDEQQITPKLREEVRQHMAQIAANVEKFLRLCVSCGEVILVTLAKRPWVTDSCRLFFPGIADVISSLGIKIVYAQQGIQVEYDKLEMMQNHEVGLFWSRIKGDAISKEIQQFYSRYDGQSWKNIISVGDSDFERHGTMMSTGRYMEQKGIDAQGGSPLGEAEIRGHVYRVRTKTFKMLDEPLVEELAVELDLLHKWLPLMVSLDDGFDVEVSSLDNAQEITDIEARLEGKKSRAAK